MAGFEYTDNLVVNGIPVNGVTLAAYRLTRCPGGVLPAKGAAAPSGAADISVVTDPAFGTDGGFVLVLPTSEDYALLIPAASAGTNNWRLVPAPVLR